MASHASRRALESSSAEVGEDGAEEGLRVARLRWGCQGPPKCETRVMAKMLYSDEPVDGRLDVILPPNLQCETSGGAPLPEQAFDSWSTWSDFVLWVDIDAMHHFSMRFHKNCDVCMILTRCTSLRSNSMVMFLFWLRAQHAWTGCAPFFWKVCTRTPALFESATRLDVRYPLREQGLMAYAVYKRLNNNTE